MHPEFVDRQSYIRRAEEIWARNRPRTWFLVLLPWPWSGRAPSRSVASKLTLVVQQLSELERPRGDAEEIELNYLEPLRRAERRATACARSLPLGTAQSDAMIAMDEALSLYTDEQHEFVVRYGLPQWWLPRTEAWEPRRRQG